MKKVINIIHHLEQQDAGAKQVAAEMKERASQLFNEK